MLKIEILRGLITEKLTVTVQEILAVVETTVSGYEEEVLLLKRELSHYKRQLDATLQPRVHLNRIDFTPRHSIDESELKHEQRSRENSVCRASETCQEDNRVDGLATTAFLEQAPLEHEESDSSFTDLPSNSSVPNNSKSDVQNIKVKRRTQLPARYKADVTDSDGNSSDIEKNGDNEWKPSKNKKPRSSKVKRNCLVTLGVGLLKNCQGTNLSNNDFLIEGPLQTILCQQKLSKSDFIKQLRSTFPELGENEPFDAYLASSTNTSAPYKMTHNELYKVYKSQKQNQFDFYLQIKEPRNSCDTAKNADTLLLYEKPTSNVLEKETPLETEGVIDSASQSEACEDDDDGDDDLWKPVQNNKDEGQTIKKGEQKSNYNFCQVCGCLFRSQTILIKHALSHLDNPKCMCGVCGQQSDSSEELETHLATHRKLHKCDACGQYFLHFVSFQKHIATHGIEKPFNCHICQKFFISDESLKKHQLQHNNNKPYKCDICTQSFKYKSLLKIHCQKHTGDKPYCCDVCGKSLSDYRSLCRHLLTHSGEKNYSCQTCGKKFYSVMLMKQHEKIHTVREKKYLCDICSKTFFTKQALWTHQKIHDLSHVVKCPFCKKLLKGKGTLDSHVRTHTGERPFVCSQCGKKFKARANLRDHMATHLTVKPLTCSVCGYKCVRKHYLDTHMRTHTGHKPYKCTVCDKAFTQSHCLKTHMKSHQAEEQPDVDSLA